MPKRQANSMGDVEWVTSKTGTCDSISNRHDASVRANESILLRTGQPSNPGASISLAKTGLPLVALGSFAAQESIGNWFRRFGR